jgi:hypothetical protein
MLYFYRENSVMYCLHYVFYCVKTISSTGEHVLMVGLEGQLGGKRGLEYQTFQ